MKSIQQIGLKITKAQREYFRYTGVSAELEKRGAGTSHPELAWVRREKQSKITAGQTAISPPPSVGR